MGVFGVCGWGVGWGCGGGGGVCKLVSVYVSE